MNGSSEPPTSFPTLGSCASGAGQKKSVQGEVVRPGQHAPEKDVCSGMCIPEGPSDWPTRREKRRQMDP